jgi:hypothetical protein
MNIFLLYYIHFSFLNHVLAYINFEYLAKSFCLSLQTLTERNTELMLPSFPDFQLDG